MDMKEFLADIYFYKTDEGGRKSDIPIKMFSFRPLLSFNSKNYHVIIDSGEYEILRLGHNYELKIRVLTNCPIDIGSVFELKELKTIAKGKIINSVNSVL